MHRLILIALLGLGSCTRTCPDVGCNWSLLIDVEVAEPGTGEYGLLVHSDDHPIEVDCAVSLEECEDALCVVATSCEDDVTFEQTIDGAGRFGIKIRQKPMSVRVNIYEEGALLLEEVFEDLRYEDRAKCSAACPELTVTMGP